MPGLEPRQWVSTTQDGKCPLQSPEATCHCEGGWLSHSPQVLRDSDYRPNNCSLSFTQELDTLRRYIMPPPCSSRWHQEIMVSYSLGWEIISKWDSGSCEATILQGFRIPRMGWWGHMHTPGNQVPQLLTDGWVWRREGCDRGRITRKVHRGGCRGTSKPFSRINYLM